MPGAALALTVNTDRWASFPRDLQIITKNAAAAENGHIYDEFTHGNAEGLQQLIDKHGVQMRRLPDDVLKALKKTSDEVLQELVADNAEAGKVYDSYKQFLSLSVPYLGIAEQAALNARSMVMGMDGANGKA